MTTATKLCVVALGLATGLRLPPLSRRQAVPLAALALSTPAAWADADALADRLHAVGEALEASRGSLERGDYDDPRRTVQQLTALLNTKGYLGDSVKARARERGDDGAELEAARRTLLKAMYELDNFCYLKQKRETVAASTGVDALESCIAGVSAVRAKL